MNMQYKNSTFILMPKLQSHKITFFPTKKIDFFKQKFTKYPKINNKL